MLQTSEIVLYILVTFNFGLCLILTTGLWFIVRNYSQRIEALSEAIRGEEIERLDLKCELSLKYDEQLAALAKGHNELVAQMNELSGKLASLNTTVQGGRLNGTKTNQTSPIPSIFPGRF